MHGNKDLQITHNADMHWSANSSSILNAFHPFSARLPPASFIHFFSLSIIYVIPRSRPGSFPQSVSFHAPLCVSDKNWDSCETTVKAWRNFVFLSKIYHSYFWKIHLADATQTCSLFLAESTEPFWDAKLQACFCICAWSPWERGRSSATFFIT